MVVFPIVSKWSIWCEKPNGCTINTMKKLIWVGMFVGSIIGGYIPVLFGASLFSFSSLIGNGLGSIVGIIAGYKLASYMGLN